MCFYPTPLFHLLPLGYSSHDDSYSEDERRPSRGGARGVRGKGRRSNLKDDTTSESDGEYHPSDMSDDGRPPRVTGKRSRRGRKKAESEEEASLSNSESADSAELVSTALTKLRFFRANTQC